MVRAEHLGEVHIGAFGLEVGVVTHFGADLVDHGLIGVRHKDDCVGHAGVERVNGRGADGEGNLFTEAEAVRRREIHRHALALEAGGDDAGHGLKRHAAGCSREALDVAGEAACPVATHLGAAPVAVPELPSPVGLA